jgi:hypothetical protein
MAIIKVGNEVNRLESFVEKKHLTVKNASALNSQLGKSGWFVKIDKRSKTELKFAPLGFFEKVKELILHLPFINRTSHDVFRVDACKRFLAARATKIDTASEGTQDAAKKVSIVKEETLSPKTEEAGSQSRPNRSDINDLWIQKRREKFASALANQNVPAKNTDPYQQIADMRAETKTKMAEAKQHRLDGDKVQLQKLRDKIDAAPDEENRKACEVLLKQYEQLIQSREENIEKLTKAFGMD